MIAISRAIFVISALLYKDIQLLNILCLPLNPAVLVGHRHNAPRPHKVTVLKVLFYHISLVAHCLPVQWRYLYLGGFVCGLEDIAEFNAE